MNFAIIGVGGYIAPRHLEAIKAVGGKLVAAYDLNDSVGILDRYAPEFPFFTQFEKFDLYLEELRSKGTKIDYFTICSPNDLHLPHIYAGLRNGADVICEKPLVTSTGDLQRILDLETKFGKKVYTILQLRVHPKLVELKADVDAKLAKGEKFDVNLEYVTSRGPWYYASWKGLQLKSGGVGFNIGVHFFDMLCWLFGEHQEVECKHANLSSMSGSVKFKQANVNWKLSINRKDLPEAAVKANKTTYRSITINGQEVEFSEGFTELHTEIYKRAMQGNGFGAKVLFPATKMIEEIRSKHKLVD